MKESRFMILVVWIFASPLAFGDESPTCLDGLCIPKNYSREVVPSRNMTVFLNLYRKMGTFSVSARCEVRQVDTKKMIFTLFARQAVAWQDPRLIYVDTIPAEPLNKLLLKKLWIPEVTLENQHQKDVKDRTEGCITLCMVDFVNGLYKKITFLSKL